jgi:hypothetical protein
VDEVRVSMGDARVTHYHATTRVRVHGHGDPPPGQVELDVAGPGVVASLTYVADETWKRSSPSSSDPVRSR